MEVLNIDGKRYVKAAKAAADLGYAKDYVSQLCRKGHVDARLVGRTWYVDQDELGTHRVEKKRNARVKAREHAKRTLMQVAKEKELSRSPQKAAHSLVIRYESDPQPLVPVVRKVSISSEPLTRNSAPLPVDEAPDYVIENEHKRILMQGTISVVDAELEESTQNDHTVTLIPRIIKRRNRGTMTTLPPNIPNATDSEGDTLVPIESLEPEKTQVGSRNKTFLEKIQDAGGLSGEEAEQVTENPADEVESAPAAVRITGIVIYSMTIVIMLFCIASVFIERRGDYIHDKDEVEYTFGFSSEKPTNYISNMLKIYFKI